MLRSLAFAVVAVTALASAGAMAGSSTAAERQAVRASSAPPHSQGRQFARRLYRKGLPNFVGPAPAHAVPEFGYRWGPAGYAYYGPGYIFVPHRGILNEACNLPTSTCPNEVRDIP